MLLTKNQLKYAYTYSKLIQDKNGNETITTYQYGYKENYLY